MKRYYFLITILFIFLGGCQSIEGNRVCFDDHCFNVEVTQSPKDRARGLMFRESMDSSNGMLFIFPKNYKHSFWMKNTLIPLDIIWMDYSRRIVHIESDVPPCKADPCPHYTPKASALYVLEINAGQAQKRGIKEGDVAEFQLELKQ